MVKEPKDVSAIEKNKLVIENDTLNIDKMIEYDGSEDEAWQQSTTVLTNFSIRPGYIPIESIFPITNRFICKGYNGLNSVNEDNTFGVYYGGNPAVPGTSSTSYAFTEYSVALITISSVTSGAAE